MTAYSWSLSDPGEPQCEQDNIKWLHFNAQCVIVSSYRASLRQTVGFELRLIAVFLYLHLQPHICAMSMGHGFETSSLHALITRFSGTAPHSIAHCRHCVCKQSILENICIVSASL